jgi:hypothetical protein
MTIGIVRTHMHAVCCSVWFACVADIVDQGSEGRCVHFTCYLGAAYLGVWWVYTGWYRRKAEGAVRPAGDAAAGLPHPPALPPVRPRPGVQGARQTGIRRRPGYVRACVQTETLPFPALKLFWFMGACRLGGSAAAGDCTGGDRRAPGPGADDQVLIEPSVEPTSQLAQSTPSS